MNLAELNASLCKRYPFMEGFNTVHDKVDICYYGCSFTVGIGVEPQQTWTALVDNYLNCKSNNFGIEGIGIDEILNVFINTTQYVKMDRAIFLLPSELRQTIAIGNGSDIRYRNIFPNYTETLHSDHEALNIAKHWYSLPNSYFIDKAKIAIDTIDYIAKLNNIKIYFSSYNKNVFNLLPPANTLPKFVNDNLGSDGIHPGTQAHYTFAQEIIKIL